jgi:hypothetical protein
VEDFVAILLKEYPSTIELLEKFAPTLIAFLAGSFATCITGIFSYRQWRTARDKLRLDLFDRRFALFEDYFAATTAALAKWQNQEELFRKFAKHRGISKFLFEEDVANLVEQTIEVIVRLEILENRRFQPNNEKKWDEDSKEIEKRIIWLAETQNQVIAMFEKYLSFKNVKV